MWKLLSGISLTLCVSAMAEDTPPKPLVSVQVECCGRLRHGLVAIGCETTGTTITFNRIIWELQLHDEAARVFAREHHKKPVVVTGALRKVGGVEAKDRWIIDVKTLAECDSAKGKEGSRLTIQGTLQTTESRQGDSPGMIVVTGDHAWPVDFTTDASPRPNALVGEWVVLTGRPERVIRNESDDPQVVVRVKTLKRSAKSPISRQSD